MSIECAYRSAILIQLKKRIFYPLRRITGSSHIFLCAVTALAVQGALLGTWLVDDAGISMAYAHNLACHGQLVSQIGAVPVEGFSNPLWVFLLACFQSLSSTVVVLKSLSMGFLVWTLWRLCTAFPVKSPERLVASMSAFFLALQPSVVVWGFSGLENPLYLAAGVELMILMCRAASTRVERREPLLAGVAAACLALTRPEGLLFSPLYTIAYLYGCNRVVTRRLVVLQSFAVPLLCLALYVLFRYTYFGDVLPNTHMAKGGPSLNLVVGLFLLDFEALAPVVKIFQAVFGTYMSTWGMVFSIVIVGSAWRRRQEGMLVGAGLLLVMATIAYLLLPQDWMPELRYATLVFPAIYLLGCGALFAILTVYWFRLVMSCLVVLSAGMSIHRTCEFRDNPPISISEVKERSDKISHWGTLLGVNRPSLLTADIGGALLRDEVEIVDLGMLADRVIAEALGEGSKHRDVKTFQDYIFEQRKPVFMELRAYHSWITHFSEDPRFRRDYVAIREYRDAWVRQRYGENIWSGDYVRKDALTLKTNEFYQIQREAAAMYYPCCAIEE